MQKAQISSVLFISLLEQIFERYSKGTPNEVKDKEILLLDLHKLLGNRLVPAALNILDNRTIIIYRSSPKTIEVADIFDHKSNLRLVRLIVHLNYCTCEYFKEKVLNSHSPAAGSYTCHHVLAVRLAIALQHSCLEFKEVPSHNLVPLLNSFLPEIPETN